MDYEEIKIKIDLFVNFVSSLKTKNLKKQKF